MDQYQVIIGPIVTERSYEDMELNKYTFRVNKKANKAEIKNAVEKMFDVEVEKVRTMNMRGKKRRQGMAVGKSPDWKKAVVTLKPDSKSIEFFDSL